jgi:hypothetical protein
MSYFQHWNEWKRSRYREDWFYQPLRKIWQDLTGAYSLHVIQKAIASLVKLEFLSVKKNDRTLNNRNGQDKTHRYLLHCDRVNTALAKAKLSSQSKKSKTNIDTPCISPDTSRINPDTSRITVETHTKILSTNPSTNPSSLSEREKGLDFVQEEDEDPWTVEEVEVEQDLVASFEDKPEISQEQEGSNEDQFSAAPVAKCVEVVQNDVNELKPLPKLKSDSVSGFRSPEERENFYQELLVLGKTKGEVRSPVGWASAIVKDIDAGKPCEYLNEYRAGLPLGRCEQQEWEVAPGKPHEQFVTYLKTKIKKTGMTDEEAYAAAYQQLRDVNLARAQWESCKRSLVRHGDEWEKQKQLDVQNAYVPPELLPEREVSLEEAASAMASLQRGCVQLQGLAESAKLNSATAELEPAKELVIESAIAELEPVTTADAAAADDLEPAAITVDPEPDSISIAALQEKLDSRIHAPLARMMARNLGHRIEEDLVLPAGEIPPVEHLRSLLTNPTTAPRVKRLIEAHPDWGFWIDDEGEISDF